MNMNQLGCIWHNFEYYFVDFLLRMSIIMTIYR